ncbi:LOW QUALITY PROTEIN: hypothetical protein PanWU01x14_042380 [Parasponia andersonii]|uniref:Uncharacterized protein n=1 Tax=Parasponia andersonii TaxID=3476 RepID=A0A2P5DQP1_PARAD|nr:LOW QUALITY PROTEIN: hypothetical protein PanWU01x14_042380 [Parasponia andersonii]
MNNSQKTYQICAKLDFNKRLHPSGNNNNQQPQSSSTYMVSCLNRPPNTFLTSGDFTSVCLPFGLDFGSTFDFEAGLFCLTMAFRDGSVRALACPLTVAICTFGVSWGF